MLHVFNIFSANIINLTFLLDQIHEKVIYSLEGNVECNQIHRLLTKMPPTQRDSCLKIHLALMMKKSYCSIVRYLKT